MKKYKNKHLEQLFAELRFVPDRKKRKQLSAVNKLICFVKKDQPYPLEFICYKITGYRPKGDLDTTIVPGKDLIHDLKIFSYKLNLHLAIDISLVDEVIFTIDQLSERFSVSAKTIQRWKDKGLFGRIYIFPDGQKRIGFLQSSVEQFLDSNDSIIKKARKFSRLSESQKQEIISLAGKLARDNRRTRQEVLLEVAAETQRARETVRYTIREYEKQHEDNKVFKDQKKTIKSKDISTIYKLYKQNVGVSEIACRFSRSRSSIYRIINKYRAKDILSRKITYIDSNEFLQDDIEKIILTETIDDIMKKSSGALLSRQQEMDLFRRYNFLKYRSCILCTQIKSVHPSSIRLKKIEACLSEADRIKDIIIEANLRLVMSIAGKHSRTGGSIADLVGEGNITLMRAVEKFDYTRGYRFSTYASWAIIKDFARSIPAEASRLDKPSSADIDSVRQDMRLTDASDFEAIERAHHSLDMVIENNLNEREKFIVCNHFALNGGIKTKPKTLKQIGQELGLSKERVRQIELLALQKLRHSLSAEEFDLLTG